MPSLLFVSWTYQCFIIKHLIKSSNVNRKIQNLLKPIPATAVTDFITLIIKFWEFRIFSRTIYISLRWQRLSPLRWSRVTISLRRHKNIQKNVKVTAILYNSYICIGNQKYDSLTVKKVLYVLFQWLGNFGFCQISINVDVILKSI